MDPSNTQKLQSTQNDKKFKFLSTLFLHSVLALICTLFCSYNFWFPLLCSSINSFSFVSLLNFNQSFFFNPKFLFMVANAIIIFLVGESKLSNPSSSPATEIYNGESKLSNSSSSPYNGESKLSNLTSSPATEIYNGESKLSNSSSSPATEIYNGESKLSNPSSSPATEIDNEYVQKSRELSRQMEKNEEQNLGIKIVTEDSVKMIENEAEEREEEEEEESGLETEELNKRVEDFIARVKRQRLAETRFEVFGR